MSGSSVAYHLRVNKYVDRKLFLEAITLVARYFPVAQYAYVSMGGGYLEDFRAIHQGFGIRQMLSFDMDAWVIGRQLVNRPYGFIRCVRAKSEEIINRLDQEREKLVGSDGNIIIWLDYTEADQRFDQLTDLQNLTSKLIHGDVFRITINAHREAFGSTDKYLISKKTEETDAATATEWWHEQLVEQLGDFLPPERNDSDHMDSPHEFAVSLARSVRRAALGGLESASRTWSRTSARSAVCRRAANAHSIWTRPS